MPLLRQKKRENPHLESDEMPLFHLGKAKHG
jgi:hypothetical protein